MTQPIDLRRAARQQLESLKAAGLTHLPRSSGSPSLAMPSSAMASPVMHSPEAAVPDAAQASAATAPPAETKSAESLFPAEEQGRAAAAARSSPPPPAIGFAALQLTPPNRVPCTLTRAERVSQLAGVAARVQACVRCPELAATRTQTVFGVGNPEAKIMYLGEAPGADEDRTGEPFVGAAGQLLNRIIEACGLKRHEIYICNVLRCRPPENRTPSLLEANNCREYLDDQIRIVDPDYIVCWGLVAAQNLLGVSTSVGKMRGRFFEYGRAKVAVTYHPSYLLRNPGAKKDVWDDMKRLMRDMGVTL